MTEPADNPQHETPDPLTVGELRPLKDWVKEFPLSYHSLRTYAKNGRLRAVKFGNQWATTRAAIEEYLATRDLDSIPKKYRKLS
ncbi:MAG: hypothetical protein RLZZ387_440 [Chloroflexota bacterium]|jgi:hypothetical protein